MTLSLLLYLCLYPQPARAEAITLKISTIALEGSTQDKALKEAAGEIAEKTGGAVKIKVYYGGSMGTGDTLFRKLKFKQLDGGSFTVSEASQYCPDLVIPSLSFLFDRYEQVDCVFPRFIETFDKGFEDRGFVLLAVVETGFSYLMSVKPVRNVSDLQAMRVWTPADDWVGQIELEQFGVTPRPMSLSQATSGLMTGLVDTVGGPFIAAVGLQWITKVKYVLDVPLLYTFSVLLVSKHSFDKIEAAHRAIVKQAFARYFQSELRNRTREDNRQARAAMRDQGIEFIVPNEQQIASFTVKLAASKQEIEAAGKLTAGALSEWEAMIRACGDLPE